MEGCEGAGKSLQCKKLYAYLVKKGLAAVLTREPGGAALSEQIRRIILAANARVSPKAEALLYAAARAQHVAEVIGPAMENGRIVICDRFTDSSVAYQGYARGLGAEAIINISEFATGGLKPDVSFFLDIRPEDSFTRKADNTSKDRIELEEMAFHNTVYSGYKRIASTEPGRVITVDANRGQRAVHADILEKVNHILCERGFIE